MVCSHQTWFFLASNLLSIVAWQDYPYGYAGAYRLQIISSAHKPLMERRLHEESQASLSLQCLEVNICILCVNKPRLPPDLFGQSKVQDQVSPFFKLGGATCHSIATRCCVKFSHKFALYKNFLHEKLFFENFKHKNYP